MRCSGKEGGRQAGVCGSQEILKNRGRTGGGKRAGKGEGEGGRGKGREEEKKEGRKNHVRNGLMADGVGSFGYSGKEK